MQGRRVEWTAQILAPGEYAKLPDGTWMAETPNGHGANLSRHQVTEHEDGTITVSPSILVSLPGQHYTRTADAMGYPMQGTELWHGFLERGVWRAV
jgi:hypothetical protein